MKQSIKIASLLLIVVTLITASCSSTKKSGGCGCPGRQGMVGF